MPTLVVGCGGVGLFLTHLLSANKETHALARGLTLERLQTEGFVVFDSGEVHTPKVPAMDWESWVVDDQRWRVLVAVKAGELDSVLDQLARRRRGVDCLFLLQNGLGILEQAATRLPGTPAVRVSCYTGVEREAPTAIRIHGRGAFRIAGQIEAQEQISWFQSQLESAGFPVQVVGSPHRMEWEKAMMNLVVNGICTLVAAKNGALIDSPGLHELAEQVLDECMAVSLARGVVVKSTMKEDVFAAIERVRDNSNSTLQDLLARRSTELDYLHGRVIEWGEQAKVPTPTVKTLYQMLGYLEFQRTGQSASPWPQSIWPVKP